MPLLKLGIIDYLNVLPVYYCLLKKRFPEEWNAIMGTPTELNNLISQGKLDISVVSSFEYASNSHLYYLFPNLSVSADGPVRSIYLLSHSPWEKISGAIYLTPTSATSIHLSKYLLRNHPVSFHPLHEKGKQDTVLLIGDEAIQAYYANQYTYAYDLSLLWKEETGYPFVFAVWVVRRDVFNQNPQQVQRIYQALLKSKKESEQLYQLIAEDYNNGIFPSIVACVDYLRNLKYDLSSSFQEGFLLFQEKCVQQGFLTNVQKLAFIKE